MRSVRVLLAGAAACLLAGCASAAGSTAPTWVPSPAFGSNGEGPGVHVTPIIPVPSAGAPSPAPASGTRRPGAGPRPSASKGSDPQVVAKHLRAPVGLALLPDNSALVGERTTGRIVRVQPEPNQPVPTVRTLTSLDTAGDGGLLDLALSPTYGQDNLIYAYITTATDNRVVDFTLTGPVAPVVTGIPKGRTGNTGRIAFGADGDLYIGTGDAGRPASAADPKSLAGKVLRVSDIGGPVAGNPTGSLVFTSGHHVVDGLCPATDIGAMLAAEPSSTGAGALNQLTARSSYGWPKPTATTQQPIATLPAAYAGPGGCAVLDGFAYVTSLDGHSLLAARLTDSGAQLRAGRFTAQLRNRYGRLRTVVAAQDGALWLTTSNRDGEGKPVPDDERVIRYVPAASGGGSNPA